MLQDDAVPPVGEISRARTAAWFEIRGFCCQLRGLINGRSRDAALAPEAHEERISR